MRYKETMIDCFFGSFLYQQKIAKDHLLRRLDEVIDWGRFTQKVPKYYRGKEEIGQAPYTLPLILKMPLIYYLYSISKGQVEILANDRLSISLLNLMLMIKPLTILPSPYSRTG